MILHTVNKTAALDDCLRLAPPGGGILLIEDGVYAALDTPGNRRWLEAAARTHKLYALAPDLRARGLGDRLPAVLEQVSYAGFVELCVQFPRIQSWY